MDDKEFYKLISDLEVAKTSLEKDIENLKTNFEKDISHLDKISEQIKEDLFEFKANSKTIHQNEVDIAKLIEKAESNTKLLESYKKELEAKMVTKDYLETKKYKDVRLWLAGIAVLASIGFSLYNSYQMSKKIENLQSQQKNTSGGKDVLSGNKK
jgi:DNA repair exonuclease SbcCD ATPase subunit